MIWHDEVHEMTHSTHTFLHLTRSNKRGDVVGIFIVNKFSQIRMLESQKCNTFEHIVVSFMINSNQKITFIVVYGLPNTSFTSL